MEEHKDIVQVVLGIFVVNIRYLHASLVCVDCIQLEHIDSSCSEEPQSSALGEMRLTIRADPVNDISRLLG